MTPVSLQIHTLPFVTEQGVPVPARRPFLAAQFLGPRGGRVPYPTFFDTGAAYSVVPFTLAAQVIWKTVGTQLVLAGNAHPVHWHGVPCVLGELEVELVDPPGGARTAALRVLAKVASRPAPPPLEQAALLGMSFLTDNGLRLELDATGAHLVGQFGVP